MLDVAVRKRLGAFALDVAFTAPARGVTALFGRSGSGKTSTVAAIAGLLRPDDGHVRLDGATFFDRARGIDLPVERRRVGYVFQDGRLFPHMSVAGNLTYGLRRAPRSERRIALDRVVALLGLERLLPRRPAGLSGGEKQRVALGRALLAQPRLLLMDEPLASLDAPRKAEILPYIERLRDELGLPIVYVSHAVEEVVRLADTLVLIDHGRAAAVGDIHDLMARLDLHPLTGRYEAGAVIDAVVADHDPAYALTGLAFQGGRLVAPRIDLPVGARLRVRVRARDVMVALKAPEDVSVQNILPGRVAEVRVEPGAYAEVRIEVGDGSVAVVARITRQSADRLGLAPGLPVHALIKSISLDRHSLGFSDRADGRDADGPEESTPGGRQPPPSSPVSR